MSDLSMVGCPLLVEKEFLHIFYKLLVSARRISTTKTNRPDKTEI